MSAAFSPIMAEGAWVLPLTRSGMIEASATRSPSTPRTLKVGSTTELAESLERLIASPSEYQKRQEMAMNHSGRFTWEKCVSETLDLYRDLAAS